MKYRLIQRANPMNRQEPMKWYAIPVNDGTVSKNELSLETQQVSSLARGDVSNVIETLMDIIPKYLLMGKSVNLSELGTFRASFGSEGVDNPEDFHPSMIRNIRIIFTPSTALRNRLPEIRFELARGFETGSAPGGGSTPEEPEEPGDI